jgi:dTDP-4-amino-4,6-dideoxygalactose transaminase
MQLAINGGKPVRVEPFPAWPQWDEREERNLLSVLRSGKWFRYEGNMVAEFERQFANCQGARYGLAVNSGTAALEASMAALGVGGDDEVIVPSYTFMATAAAVVTAGATPVFADIDLATLNIDLASAESLINPRTKAIIPVHFGGCPCDMDAVTALAKRHGIGVVEDAAHAHGGKWAGRGMGSIGDLGAFSFQNSKNITAGEGGMVLSNDEELISRAFSHHSYGQRPGAPWYSHYVVSRNLRMTEWQGAILLAQTERLQEQSTRRLHNARILDAAIGSLEGLTVVGSCDSRAAERAYHLYQFRYSPGWPGVSRERFVQALRAEGIPCSTGYPVPLYQQPFFEVVQPPAGQGPYAGLRLPNVERACKENLWLAQSVLLGDEKDMRDIADALAKVAELKDQLLER